MSSLAVGFPLSGAKYPSGESVASVASQHEFGSGNVPERSFIRSTLHQHNNYKQELAQYGKQILMGKLSQEKALNLLGLVVQTDIKDTILAGVEPPLTSREGVPLVDTGLLLQSIGYEII